MLCTLIKFFLGVHSTPNFRKFLLLSVSIFASSRLVFPLTVSLLSVSLAVHTTSETVKAPLGKSLTLPCGLWRGQQSRFATEWRHRSQGDGKVLYAYDGSHDRIEEELPGYTMNFSTLYSKGDASLVLEKVETSHEGAYLCVAYVPYLRAQRDIHVVVTGKN